MERSKLRVLYQRDNLVFAASTVEAGGFTLQKRAPILSLEERDGFTNQVHQFVKQTTDMNSVVVAELVHGGASRAVNRSSPVFKTNPTFVPGVDALVTAERRMVLVVRGSDCPPVVLFDAKRKAFALAHAGRDSLKDWVMTKAFGTLRSLAKSEAGDCQAFIGPGICKKCFGNGRDRAEPFLGQSRANAVEKRGDSYHLDLNAEIKSQLKQCGVESVIDSRICTFESDGSEGREHWLSYRRRKDNTLAPSNHLYFAWMT